MDVWGWTEGLKLMVDAMKLPVRNYAVEQIVDFFFSFHLIYYRLVVQYALSYFMGM